VAKKKTKSSSATKPASKKSASKKSQAKKQATTSKATAKKVTKKKVTKKVAASKKVAKVTKKPATKKQPAKKPSTPKQPANSASTSKAPKTAKVTKKVTKSAKTTKVNKSTTKKKVIKKVAKSAAKTTKRTKPRFKYIPPEAEAKVTEVKELTIDELRKVKTGLGKKDLSYFKSLLLDKRAEIIGDVESMETARQGAQGGDSSHMPLHMADVGSDNFEQEFNLGLVEVERKVLHEIDEALERLVEGYYGVCLDMGTPIGRPRLEAKPWAKYCIEAVREREKRGLY